MLKKNLLSKVSKNYGHCVIGRDLRHPEDENNAGCITPSTVVKRLEGKVPSSIEHRCMRSLSGALQGAARGGTHPQQGTR